jgi:hypothetical protein
MLQVEWHDTDTPAVVCPSVCAYIKHLEWYENNERRVQKNVEVIVAGLRTEIYTKEI